MITFMTAQYRHIVVGSGIYTVRSKSLHGRYSSGCIGSTIQPSPKSSRTTLHYMYVIQNDSAHDLAYTP